MINQMHLFVQWQDGSILPILCNVDSCGQDLLKMLRFACGPNQNMTIYFKDSAIEEDHSLENIGLSEGDVIHAVITPDAIENSHMNESFDQIAREAARIRDLQLDNDEMTPRYTYDYKFADKFRFNVNSETIIPNPVSVIPTTPLPTFWNHCVSENEDDNDPPIQKNTTYPRFRSIEEAGKFYSRNDWNEWIW